MKTCVEKHPCDTGKSGCSDTCTPTTGQDFVCGCPSTKQLSGKFNCVDKHPCDIGNGGCSERCVRKANQQFECQCDDPTKELDAESNTCVASELFLMEINGK